MARLYVRSRIASGLYLGSSVPVGGVLWIVAALVVFGFVIRLVEGPDPRGNHKEVRCLYMGAPIITTAMNCEIVGGKRLDGVPGTAR